MDYFYEISLFSLKALIIVIGLIAVILIPTIIIKKGESEDKKKKKFKLENLKDQYKRYIVHFKQKTLEKKEFKKYIKSLKKEKSENRQENGSGFVLSFKGDTMATQVEDLREEISLILEIASPKDEVILLLESRGGSVAHYGLAASQLQRLRNHNIPLTVCVDKVAGSGGYLMACVGNQIISAPFAFIGSIGVLFGLPNIHDFLKKHDISYEEITAGEYKRTLTPLGKVTEEKRKKLKEQLDLIHNQFKNFVKQYRDIDMDQIATGETWLAEEALKKGLVDKIQCSDDYIIDRSKTRNVYKVSLKTQKSFFEKLISKRSVSGKVLNNLFSKDLII